MSSEKCLALVILAAAAATVTLAKPSGIALSIVKDKTICKTVVDYDVDEDRIPRVIKVLKCADAQPAACPASNAGGGKVQCCERGWLDGPQFKCTEILDSVLVNHKKQGVYTRNVAVGCACIRQDSNEALEFK